MSSSKTPLIFFVIVLFLLGGGVLYMYKFPHSASKYAMSPISTSPSEAMMPHITPTPPPLPSGTTDQQLNQDTQAIDQSLTGTNTDITNIDGSLNDQQTNLQ